MKKKKIIITLIVIALILVLVGFIAEKVQQKNKEYEIAQIKEYKYFVVKENDKYGVINTNGEKIVKTEYDDVKIPNPEKAVFICYKDNNTKVLNEKGEEIYTEYKNIEP